jgi:hypothetical protein
MHFHLPKPLHGWREFAGEVGIIVVGVLIALGAEQVVETIHWRQRVADSNKALALEIGEAVGQGIIRIGQTDCIEGRLDWLSAVVDKAAETGELPPIGRIAIPQYFTWPSGAWQSIVNGDVANHQPREKLQALSGFYNFNNDINAEQLHEMEHWTDIYQLVGPGRTFDREDAARARSAIALARYSNRMIGLDAVRMIQLLRVYGIHYDGASVRLYTKDDHYERGGHCRPMGEPVAHYGEAPLRGTVKRALAHPLTKPGS